MFVWLQLFEGTSSRGNAIVELPFWITRYFVSPPLYSSMENEDAAVMVSLAKSRKQRETVADDIVQRQTLTICEGVL